MRGFRSNVEGILMCEVRAHGWLICSVWLILANNAFDSVQNVTKPTTRAKVKVDKLSD